jgi:hypothetical protein
MSLTRDVKLNNTLQEYQSGEVQYLRFNYLSICLLAMIVATGAAAALEIETGSLDQSLGLSQAGFSQEFVNSLFGIGGQNTALSEEWYGPEFENTSSAYSFLSEFYIENSLPVTGGFTPMKIDLTRNLPAMIYFGNGQEISFTQYQSAVAPSRENELWIQKARDWSQYAIVPAGVGMQFIAFAPNGGQADYLEILQTDSQSIANKRVSFFAGYNSINFLADKVGRHILLFVLNNQPSNAIIVDVISQAPTISPAAASGASTGNMPPAYGQTGAVTRSYTQTTTTGLGQTTTMGLGQTTTSTSTKIQSYGTPLPTQTVASGDTPVIIQSQGMRGYQVYLDEVLIGVEGTNGDALDGKFSFSVVGNQNHNIRVYDGQFNYPKSMYFARGVTKIINVEPGTEVYI